MLKGLFLYSICSISLAILIETIPPQGTPPNPILYTNSVYDEFSNSIIIVGGQSTDTLQASAEIFGFNLTTLKWFEIIPDSDFVPNGFILHHMFLTRNREILVFFSTYLNRCINNVYSFDLVSRTWTIKNIQGAVISGRVYYSITSYNYKGQDYVAVYGGFDRYAYDYSLYM